MNKKPYANALMPVAIAMAAAVPGVVEAQQGVRLEEIVVTAQRREANMQDVPIAIAAFTADDTLKLGITDSQSLAQMVPGLNFDRVPTSSTPFLRGVGTPGSAIGNEPSVATYIDDVYVPNGTAAAFEFNNISSIEVLRGPQGTLFGRNATGGVVHVHTRNPTFEPEVNAAVGFANYDTTTAQLYASTGFSDTVAANIALYNSNQNEGWGTNLPTGDEIFKDKGQGLRAKLLWEPSDRTSVLAGVVVERREGDIGMPSRVRPGTYTRGGYSPDAAGAGFYDGTANVYSLGKRYFESGSVKVRHEMDNAIFQSITAFSRAKFVQISQDNDGSPDNFFNAINYPQWQHYFTQELQLMAPDSAATQWILGAFYYHDQSVFKGHFEGNAFAPYGGAAGIAGASDTDSYSAFAEVTTPILPDTNLTIGVRYTQDDRDFEGDWYVGPRYAPIMVSPTPETDESWNAMTGRISIDHQFTDNFMAYIAYNRGFKSGIFNIAGIGLGQPAPGLLPPPVDPEDLNAYTIGFKSELFDSMVRLNVEAFYYDYSNIQVFNITPTGTQLLNGGAATIQGIDFDIAIAPVENLTVNLMMEFMEGEYDDFQNGPTFFPQPPNAPVEVPAGCPFTAYPSGSGATIQLPCDLSGNDTVQTPPFSASLSIAYDIPTELGIYTLALAYSHTKKHYIEPDNSYTTQQPTTDIVNASVMWVSPSERFNVRVWGRNLTEEESFSYIAQTANGGTRYAPREPRTYGITAGVSF
ncbi:MAG: TonB-dependent receptor [Porticoccaceae bacterium]